MYKTSLRSGSHISRQIYQEDETIKKSVDLTTRTIGGVVFYCEPDCYPKSRLHIVCRVPPLWKVSLSVLTHWQSQHESQQHGSTLLFMLLFIVYLQDTQTHSTWVRFDEGWQCRVLGSELGRVTSPPNSIW